MVQEDGLDFFAFHLGVYFFSSDYNKRRTLVVFFDFTLYRSRPLWFLVPGFSPGIMENFFNGLKLVLLAHSTRLITNIIFRFHKTTGWPKSHDTEKKLNISGRARASGLIFLPVIKACSHSISIKTRLEKTFLKYH
jgi:hypothetical protein